MTDGPSPHLTPDELDVLVSGGPLDERRAAHVAGCASCAEQAAGAQRFGADVAGRRDRAAARTPECREPEEIVLLLHAPEAQEDAAAFLTHAATCDYCGPLVEAAMHATAEEDDEDRALMTQLKTAGPEWQRQMAWRLAGAQQGSAPRGSRLWTVAALLAVAATLVLAVRIALPLWRGSGSRPELRELVAAVGNERARPVEGRLTGGFAYGPPPTLQRGPGAAAPPRVRIAEAKLEEAARANDTPDTQAALGVGLLAVGDLDKAIDALEEAVQQKPGDARFQSDLSAAYLARAKWNDRAEDWPRALAAAERAIKADPKLTEAYFNRALALEGLHLDAQAAEAWTAYQGIETQPRWKDEAGERAKKLKQRTSADQPRGNQEAREHIEDELLMKWGEAVLAGDNVTAARILNEAESAATALVAAGGDTMAQDEILDVNRANAQRRTSIMTAFARGHVFFGQARRAFADDRLAEAGDLMQRAAPWFRQAGSSYAEWAPIYRAITRRVGGAPREALSELATVSLEHVSERYFNLRGRHAWTEGVALDAIDRYDLGRERLSAAVNVYRQAGENENLASTQALLGEAAWILGDRETAWELVLDAHQHLNVLPAGFRRTHIQFLGASFALGEDLPESALHFENATLSDVAGAPGRSRTDEALVLRAQILTRLGDQAGATNDLDSAERAVHAMEDRGLRDRALADVRMTRAQLLYAVDNQRAIDETTQALEYVRRADPTIRLGTLLSLRGRSREALGDLDGAGADFLAAAEAFERKRSTLTTARDRMQSYERERSIYGELTHHYLVVRHDGDGALRMAERGRAGTMLVRGDNALQTVDPNTAHARLAGDIAVVYFATLPDRVLTWVLTRENCRFLSRPIAPVELRATVKRIHRAIQRGADLTQLRPIAQPIFDALVEPALRLAADKPTIIFIPDEPLSSLPWGALPDATATPLLALRTVGVAPSLTTFLAASERLAGFVPDDVMSIGDGHDPAQTGLPRLTVADDEAAEVGRAYARSTVLVGAAATRARFFASDHAILHFAGHTVVNLQFPLFSHFLMAPDPGQHDDGMLLVSDVAERGLPATRVAVLATCDGAAGPLIAGEGVVSIARVFLAAGVPSVVASLWPVDEQAHTLLTTFHQELRRRGDAASALAAAQRAFLDRRGRETPVRLWGGFESIGGITPVH